MKEIKTANYKKISKYNPKDPDFEMDSKREEELIRQVEEEEERKKKEKQRKTGND